MVAEGVSAGRIFEAELFRAVEFNRATWIHPHAYIHGRCMHALARVQMQRARNATRIYGRPSKCTAPGGRERPIRSRPLDTARVETIDPAGCCRRACMLRNATSPLRGSFCSARVERRWQHIEVEKSLSLSLFLSVSRYSSRGYVSFAAAAATYCPAILFPPSPPDWSRWVIGATDVWMTNKRVKRVKRVARLVGIKMGGVR